MNLKKKNRLESFDVLFYNYNLLQKSSHQWSSTTILSHPHTMQMKSSYIFLFTAQQFVYMNLSNCKQTCRITSFSMLLFWITIPSYMYMHVKINLKRQLLMNIYWLIAVIHLQIMASTSLILILKISKFSINFFTYDHADKIWVWF